ncbi:hypothetical protein K503DRAFT_859084 [Rhizopogon vinicolor AM-OR11-026]|uniref:Actin-like ATPase domain-containing protein n=1 Tax=Rhizopogon vinicolor AM-OR11-026 TaxID=1314800 RepID=A0A1B7MPV4_9AGAM|nr:hypothetical protein K503DRAFT_859084 [Rhizopogon vinicolor AM-OR11-026]
MRPTRLHLKPCMFPREPYKGKTRKLVLAFDVGTTFSGVSYCILDPGEVPVIRGVSRYPAQEQVGGDSKIPSILYYDLQGVVRAVGAEALQERIIEQAEDEGWVKLEWWKLHLRAEHLSSSHIREDDIPSLPQGKSAVQVLADFMRYLFQCARTYIEESHLNLWRSVENSIEFVLTHPNGWEGPQQQQIRRAAELAAVSDFPVEEEVQSGNQGVVIVDAGGGTIDLSAYSMKLSPTSFEEIAPAECCLQGSVFVTRRAQDLLKNKLSGSSYSSPEMIAQMTNIFDKTTKLRFRKPDEPSYIKFGTTRDKDMMYDIRSGQLKLAGQHIAGLFEPSVIAIIEAFEQQKRAASTPVNFVFLVGGFAASDWLFARLQAYFQPLGISFCRPDSHVNKAVADGAVSFYIDHLVSSRVARATYGVEIYTPFNPHDPEHQARQHTRFFDAAGDPSIPNQFASILLKGSVFVTRRAHDLLKNKLSGSNYSSPEMIAQMTGIFDKTTKLRFRKADEPSYVKFGTIRDKDLKYGIRSGQLKLAGQDIAGLFEPSVKTIIEAFEQQKRVASTPVNTDSDNDMKFVFLVGGFAASDWLFARLQEYFQPLGIGFCRPDGHVNKAVADGAVSFYIDHLVLSRVARATYGVEIYTPFSPHDPEHQARQHTRFIDAAGDPSIPNQFASILLKGTQVSELREFRQSFDFIQNSGCVVGHAVDIMCYKGNLQEPKWLDVDRSSFSTLCMIYPDLSELLQTAHPRQSASDQSDYYVLNIEVIFLFGLTELKAQGVEMRLLVIQEDASAKENDRPLEKNKSRRTDNQCDGGKEHQD